MGKNKVITSDQQNLMTTITLYLYLTQTTLTKKQGCALVKQRLGWKASASWFDKGNYSCFSWTGMSYYEMSNGKKNIGLPCHAMK